ncbi:TIGR01620 family protein [Alishewanella sp. 16-MA]|uniref:TIGR01620 family protein n=1 Tax=Alishewanella maricola TaxID=2795740 RepID=A0ABS8C0R3_9ALTE|nr:TIGR01620 family protein [Alishewanella maricola]MCB5225720.1 TIGR01620 family protein [Alishewanella maricola]MDP4944927.1 TIGR01620 family protein [Alishewanella sp.]MDP5037033.1 TIGR01620 family protein [Alishewanella sp.]MDP5187709.1 TIGR01620 family protein [Alishewanella sp.]
MTDLKPAQRFSDVADVNSPLLQPRAQFSEHAIQPELPEPSELASEPGSRLVSKLMYVGVVLVLVLAIGQWLAWWQQSWQASIPMAILSSLLSVVLGSVVLIVGFREWQLWRRLKQNQRWQQQAARINDSVQFGEAPALCQDMLAVLPPSSSLTAATARWQQALTPEHSDQEQLNLFNQLVLSDADTKARQVIWRASTDSSLAVAISPFALADMLLVLWRSSRMLRELAQVYGAPIGQLRSMAMLKRTFTALLWAGGSEVVLDMASDVLSSELTAKISARAGQGVIAGLLVARIGSLAQQQLRPLPLQVNQKVSVSELAKVLVGRFKGQTATDNKS